MTVSALPKGDLMPVLVRTLTKSRPRSGITRTAPQSKVAAHPSILRAGQATAACTSTLADLPLLVLPKFRHASTPDTDSSFSATRSLAGSKKGGRSIS